MRARFPVVFCLSLVVPPPCSPATLRVPSDSATIPEALAACRDGDRVLVAPGEYVFQDPLRFLRKAVTVESEAGPKQTHLRRARPLGSSDATVVFDGSQTRATALRGFGIVGSKGTGILIEGASPTIENNWIYRALSSGIVVRGGAPRIRGNTVERCGSGREFGRAEAAISLEGSEAELIENAIVENAECGVAISGGSPRLAGNAIEGNGSYGVRAESTALLSTRDVIAGNRVAVLGENSTGTFLHDTITGNVFDRVAGIDWRGGDLTIRDSIVFGNDSGGGIDLALPPPEYEIVARFSDLGFVRDGLGFAAHLCGTTGNLCAEPLFVEPGRWVDGRWVRGDYNLRVDSPCLNAGDPAPGERDADSTRAEIGAIPFAGPTPDADGDGDGMPDWWEIRQGLDPVVDDAALDPDGDGLANEDEFRFEAESGDPDTDGDGLPDGEEVRVHGTSPVTADTDGDGIDDAAEIFHGSLPGDGGSIPEPREILVPQQVETIPRAIALSVAGDTIRVSPGEYVFDRPLSFGGRAIHLLAEGGPDATTLRLADPPAVGHLQSVVIFESREPPEAILEGFRITGGSGSRVPVSPEGRWGGGILCRAGTSPTIRGCVVTGNQAAYGGGIGTCAGAAPWIEGCLIYANRATVGGGIRAFAASIHRSTITANDAGRDAGVSLLAGEIRDSILWGNSRSSSELDLLAVEASYTCFDRFEPYDALGSFRADPRFVDPAERDFRLSPDSPCIDAADPARDDPDGSRADMGALPTDDPTHDRDTDGDGMADRWEERHGLQPGDPRDSLEDPDGDGLLNREEYAHRSDPTDPDSDGDGLADGTEVDGPGTSPTHDDTDGDGIPDRLEIINSTDPLDPASPGGGTARLAGSPVCADAVVILIDNTPSMNAYIHGELRFVLAKRLASEIIATLRPSVLFNVIALGTGPRGFSDRLLPASLETRGAEISWMSFLPPGHSICPDTALEEATAMLREAPGRRAIVIVSDNELVCAGSMWLDPAADLIARLREEDGIRTHSVYVGAYPETGRGEGRPEATVLFAGRGGGRGWILTGPGTYGPAYIRGDSNGNWRVDISDAVTILRYLFSNGPPPETRDGADVNGDDAVDLADAIGLLGYLFAGGPAPPAPFPGWGAEPITSFLRLCGDTP